MSHVSKSRNNIWHERLLRLERRLALKSRDVGRAISWNVLGGRRYFERFAPELISAHKWCFIVGCNNSGTSLLQSILEKSGQVSTLPLEGQRYTNSLVRAARRGHERVWSEFLDELRLSAGDSIECVPRILHDWMREFALPIQEIILEKTTANAVRMTWLQESFHRSYFIAIVRNGYAVAEGIRRKGNKDVGRGARHWNYVNKIMMEDARSVDNFLEVRYEDLVTNRNEMAKQIAEFMDMEASCVEAAVDEQYDLVTVDGSGRQSIRNLNSESIGRLSSDDIKTVYAEASEMLERFGYKSSDSNI